MPCYEDVVAMWRSFEISSSASLAQHLENHRILFAYNSNKIENENTSYNDVREIFDRGRVVNYTGDVRTLFEIQNQKDAYGFLIRAFQKRVPITEKFVKKVHRLLTKETYDAYRYQQGERPGEYKKHNYETSRNEVGALPEDVAEKLSELLTKLAESPLLLWSGQA